MVAGAANAVNLTDGLDGLAAGICAMVLLCYTGIAFVSDQRDLAIFGATLVGACVGFLWFNSFPAAVFMGDTGSYALGGAIAAMAVMTKTEILLVVIGAIFVAEALSVIIQVDRVQALPPPGVPDDARSTTTSRWPRGARPRSSCASG